jgi:RES domain-containing protein
MPFQAKNFAISTIEIPDNLDIEELRIESLPKNWDLPGPSGYAICQDFGDKWITEAKYAVLKVPSALIAEEFNCLINPNHKDSARISVVSIKPFLFDSRLF